MSPARHEPQVAPAAASGRLAGLVRPVRSLTPAALRDATGRYGVLVVLAGLVLVFSIARPDTFATVGNFESIVTAQAVLVILALTATVTLRAGDFDLSIAATMTLSGAVTARLVTEGAPLGAAVAAAAGLALAVGLVNGLLVVVVGVDSFVTTLATMTALGGLAYAVTESQVLTGFPPELVDFATTEVLGLQACVYYGWALMLVLWYVYERTPLGRYLVFVGGGREAARLAGVRVGLLRVLAFVTSSLLAAFAGLVLIGSLGAMDPSIGPQYLLSPFAAAFLGATAIHVGRFNAVGTVLALYLLAVGITGLQLMGAEFWVADVFNGVALVLAVVVARVARLGLRRAT